MWLVVCYVRVHVTTHIVLTLSLEKQRNKQKKATAAYFSEVFMVLMIKEYNGGEKKIQEINLETHSLTKVFMLKCYV